MRITPKNPAWGRMQRILSTLGFTTDDPWGRGDFTITTVRKAVLAYQATATSEYQTSGGAYRAKTKKRREQEGAVFETLCLLLADHPNQPVGVASGGVHMNIREAVEKEEAEAALESAPPLPAQPTVYGDGLVIEKNGSAWEMVSINHEWVAQIHHPQGARNWNIHFREELPPETYSTRTACVEALKSRFSC
jgi:hypothetical protein